MTTMYLTGVVLTWCLLGAAVTGSSAQEDSDVKPDSKCFKQFFIIK